MPCFNCSFYPTLNKRGTCKHYKKQIYNTCLQTDYQITIPEVLSKHNTPTRIQVLEVRIFVLKTRLNMLETQFQQQPLDPPLPISSFPSPAHDYTPLSSEHNMVFIKTPSICNTSRAIDSRV